MEKFNTLDLSSCNTNAEVSAVISERVQSVSINELTKYLSKNFYKHEQATRCLYTALSTNNNAILYGPGGYGKSVLIKAICEALGIPLICKIGYKGMTPDELFGVPNMKLMMEESKYEIAFENSVFAQRGILIVEECLDMSPQTAAALKDVITERGFREGSVKKESLVSSIILTGNKDPEDESVDDSIHAFYIERFPHRHNMMWDTFTESDYMQYFHAIYSSEVHTKNFQKLTLVSRLCAANQKAISPRVAEQAADTAIRTGIEFLDTISALDTSMISEMRYQIDSEKLEQTELDNLSEVEEVIKDITSNIKAVAAISVLEHKKAMLMKVSEKLLLQSFSDSSTPKFEHVHELILEALEILEDKLSGLVLTEADITKINKLFL